MSNSTESLDKFEIQNNQLKQMIVILEQMSVDLIPIIMKCKCDFNSIKIKTKLNVLKQKYDFLKQNNNCNQIIDKINSCLKIKPKIVIKKIDNFDENLSLNEENNVFIKDKCLSKGRRGLQSKKSIDSNRKFICNYFFV